MVKFESAVIDSSETVQTLHDDALLKSDHKSGFFVGFFLCNIQWDFLEKLIKKVRSKLLLWSVYYLSGVSHPVTVRGIHKAIFFTELI